eukprot:TRINITY_DN368_c1_g2_i10.p1 TRINITY_DN368_c1_g2~~TRINITY_DN368_c1_g2_i10.p1  ORF type:complete len:236 (-),score=26.54 TRINITY_DN368_c1_g2_i10:7-714(-)
MEETKQASVGTVVSQQGVSITSGSTNVVWVKKVDEEDFNAEAFRFSPGCTISELKDILYASPKFALAPGTIEYISVGDEKEDNRHLVNSDHIYTLHLKEVPGRSTEALEQLQKENGTASVSLREARFREEFELLEARLREEFELREARLREELQEISSKVERKEIGMISLSPSFRHVLPKFEFELIETTMKLWNQSSSQKRRRLARSLYNHLSKLLLSYPFPRLSQLRDQIKLIV